jgi:hypothetical protein
MKAHLAVVNQQQQAQQLHEDQLKLAGVKDKQKTSDVPGHAPSAKPKHSEKVSGTHNAKAPVS